MAHIWHAGLCELSVCGWHLKMQLSTIAVFGLSQALIKVFCFQSLLIDDYLSSNNNNINSTNNSIIAVMIHVQLYTIVAV